MKVLVCSVGVLLTCSLSTIQAQGFVNLDFEEAKVISNDPTFGFLDWNLAAPGWDHLPDNPLYYGSPHFGAAPYSLLFGSNTGDRSKGTALQGNYSLAFVGGLVRTNGETMGHPVDAYISQKGIIPPDAHSLRMLLTGPTTVEINGVPIPMFPLETDSFGIPTSNERGGDISAFAGRLVELKIVNHKAPFPGPTTVDNIQFSPLSVPEPRVFFSIVLLGGSLMLARRTSLKKQVDSSRTGMSPR